VGDPKGILELNESIPAGVRREVEEETGVVVEPERPTGVYKNVALGVVALVFRAAWSAVNPLPPRKAQPWIGGRQTRSPRGWGKRSRSAYSTPCTPATRRFGSMTEFFYSMSLLNAFRADSVLALPTVTVWWLI
jgi:hypothetical protein